MEEAMITNRLRRLQMSEASTIKLIKLTQDRTEMANNIMARKNSDDHFSIKQKEMRANR